MRIYMLNFELGSIMTELEKLTRGIEEVANKLASRVALEVTELDPKTAEKEIQKVWPNVTYKGEDIIKFIMRMDSSIIRGAVGNTWQDYDHMQECYLGYDAKKDIMYMGFDVEKTEEIEDDYYDEFDDEDEVVEGTEEVFYHGWALYSIKNGRKWEEVDGSLQIEGKGFYFGGGLKTVKRMKLIGLRYD